MSSRHIPPLAYALMIALALLWGLSWPLMKLALTEMEPLRFRAFSVGVGAAGLFCLAVASKASLRITRAQFWRIASVSVFSALGWSLCMSYGLRLMASNRAAIIAYTFPVWSVPLSAWLLHEPLTARRIVGLVLGMAGLVLLLGDEIYAVGRSPVGTLLMFGTAACWALGTIVAKKYPVDVPMTTFTAWLNLVGMLPILALSALIEDGPYLPFGLSTGAMIGALYSGFAASLLAQWAWFKLVAITTATVASLSVLSVPAIGVFCSLLVLDEVPRLSDYAALVLVIGAMSTVMIPGRAAQPADAAGGVKVA